jgi:hypothetical protein
MSFTFNTEQMAEIKRLFQIANNVSFTNGILNEAADKNKERNRVRSFIVHFLRP